MKYPIGIQDFKSIITGGYTYVDKTALVYDLVTRGKIYFLSRPRRFGKSLLISTLKYYFLGERELFRGLAIDGLEKEWAEYPVFHISFGSGDYTQPYELKKVLESYVAKMEREYGKDPDALSLGLRFAGALAAAHKKTGRRAVVLIDEYDKPMLDVIDADYTVTTEDGQRIRVEEYNRNMLKGFYSVFKDADPDLQFVLLTGVTKFSQVSVFSGFNQPEDISMSGAYETLCGITENELYDVFGGRIAEMAEEYHCSYDEMCGRLKKRYDGYHMSRRMTDIYNPYSLLSALKTGEIDDYWFKTGTPSYLVRLLNHTQENINELTGKYYPVEEFVDYKANKELPLPMIYQSGYFTVKAYNPHRNSYLLDFPNDEVKNGFVSLVAANYFNKSTGIGSWVFDVLDAFDSGNLDEAHNLFTSFLSSIPYTMRRKEDERERERYFHYTLYLIMRMISCYTVYTEKQNSHGRADCIIETKDYVYIFEFKLDGTADDALRQIESAGYAQPYVADSRCVYCIGVNFSSENGTIEEWKVQLFHL